MKERVKRFLGIEEDEKETTKVNKGNIGADKVRERKAGLFIHRSVKLCFEVGVQGGNVIERERERGREREKRERERKKKRISK